MPEIVTTEPVASPLSTTDRPILFTRIVHHLYDDGTTAYGCTECTFTGVSLQMIRGHLGTQRRDPDRPKRARKPRKNPILDAADRLAADRDRWKTRAQDAERKLAAMKKALA